MSRFQLLSDAQWLLIEDLLPMRTGKRGKPFQDARQVVEGIIYRYRDDHEKYAAPLRAQLEVVTNRLRALEAQQDGG
jgi:transposase